MFAVCEQKAHEIEHSGVIVGWNYDFRVSETISDLEIFALFGPEFPSFVLFVE
jgi:hypothetical protein